MDRKHIISLAIIQLLFFLICKCVVAQPVWAKKIPVDKDYFVGIGSAPKTSGNTNHISQARDIALEQIASSIAITITSEASQSILEQAGVVSETFQANITSMTKAELEGYELVDSWENSKQYWVYYRISKAKHNENIEKKKQVATSLANDFLHEGNEAFDASEITNALSYYLQAAKAIGAFQGAGLKGSNENAEFFLDVEVFTRLKVLLSNIRFQSSPPFVEAKQFGGTKEPILVTATFTHANGSRLPLSNLPLVATTTQGKVNHISIEPTDQQGKARLSIEKILTSGNLQLSVSPNLELLGCKLPNGYSIPSRTISIQVKQVTIFVDCNELNMGIKAPQPVTCDKAKQFLTGKGWLVASSKESADYTLVINTSTRKGVERQGIHTAFASGDIALFCNQTKGETFRQTLAEVNGGGLTFENAGKQALEKLAEAIVNALDDLEN